MSRIKNTITSTLYLGQNGIGDTLAVGPDGRVAPTFYAAAGVYSGVAGGKIVNHGTLGGLGSTGFTTINEAAGNSWSFPERPALPAAKRPASPASCRFWALCRTAARST
jgi:hypothetical protein